MKRDVEMILTLLEMAESGASPHCDASQLTEPTILEHLQIMREADFIKWIDKEKRIFRITWQGYEYLESTRRST